MPCNSGQGFDFRLIYAENRDSHASGNDHCRVPSASGLPHPRIIAGGAAGMSRKWLSGPLVVSHGFDTALPRRATHARVLVTVIPLRRVTGNRPASIPGSGTARQ